MVERRSMRQFVCLVYPTDLASDRHAPAAHAMCALLRKRTNRGHLGKSALCQKRSSVASDEVRCFRLPHAVAVRGSLGLAAGARPSRAPTRCPQVGMGVE